MKEESFCCPPGGGHPSRCCPRWYVCCTEGEYGCCNPTTGLGVAAAPTTAVLLMDLAGDLVVSTIDLATGARVDVAVSGYNTYGEMTRIFTYDANRNVFYLPEANYLVAPPYPINLYTVDGTTGVATSVPTGLTGEVCSFKYEPSVDVIYMATFDNTTYRFYKLDVTGSSVAWGSSSEVDAGWWDEIAVDGSVTWRVGPNRLTSSQPGLATLALPAGTLTWTPAASLPLPPQLDWYITLTNAGANNSNTNTNTFYSLALDPAQGDYSLVTWSIGGSASAVDLGLYPPPYFGPVGQVGTGAGVLVAAVYDGLVTTLDRWVLSFNGATIVPWPWYIAETDSLSGLGLLNTP